MNRLISAVVILTIAFLSVDAQQGYFFHSQFSPLEDHRDQYHYAVEQDTNGHLYFANRLGLMAFDGNVWDLISTSGPVFSLVSYKSIIYGGGASGFGKIEPDVFGNLQFISLSDTIPEAAGVTQIAVHDSTLVMTNGYSLLEYTPATGQWEIHTLNMRIYSILTLGSRLAIQAEDGFYTKDGKKLDDKPLSTLSIWLFSTPSPDGRTFMLGNAANELFTFSSGGISPLAAEDDGYIKESVLVSASWLSPTLVAIGTLKGGVIFLNPQTKKVNQIINYHTGLPDNEIQVMYRDHSNALWIGTPHGYTRIAPEIPFKSYNYYPGLEGTIYTSGLIGREVYVGTNLGVYYLDEVRDFEEITYYVKKNPNARPEREQETGSGILSGIFSRKSGIADKRPSDNPDKKKSGLFGIGKKKAPEPVKTEPIKTTPPPPKVRRYEKKVRKELQSITYLFKKVPGIDGRVSQLLEFDNSNLVASGLDGIYLVENHKSSKIFSEAVRYTFISENKKLLLTSTYSGRLVSMIRTSGKWQTIPLLENLEEVVEYIFEDRTGRIWLCTTDKLYWIETEGQKIQEAGEFSLSNKFLDPVVGADDDSLGIVFMHARGFYKLDGDSLVGTTLFDLERPVKYLSSKKRVLVFDGRQWRVLGNGAGDPASLLYMNVFDNVVSLDARPDGTLWIVTADNQFYRIDKTEAQLSAYDPLLKQIRSLNNRLLPIGERLEVDQEESFLTFNFNLPEYSGIMKVDYRYRLVGLHDDWSEWSPTYSTIEFAYLPSGKYQLEVEARTIFGTLKKLEPVYFKVLPPYWKRSWFYGLEFLFFGSLLFLSARLSKSKNLKWQVLNRALAFITVIMVIEFLQTGVQSYFDTSNTPVIDFFVQVAIAFSLLPIESLMRSRFFREESKELAGIVSGVSKIKDSIRSKGKEGVA